MEDPDTPGALGASENPDGVGTTVAQWLDGLTDEVPLGPKAVLVRQVLTTQPTYCSYATAADVAERAEVNPATVVRFAQSLGYAGWPHLQADLRAVYLTGRFVPGQPSKADGGLLATAFARDAQSLGALERSFDFETARTVVRSIRDARRTLVVAAGTHAIPAQALAMVAASRGFPVSCEDRGGAHLAHALAALSADDCLVAWTFWPHYRDTRAALRAARRAGAVTCVVTDTRYSPPAQESDHVLVVPTEGIANIQSMTVATSVAYGLVAELTASDPAASRSAAERVSTVWQELDLFAPDGPGRGERGSGPH
ncbi:MurR/RpiR family transcriptional regulator [Streptomyces albipurpureus]|uniref:SIS domain-containing protein n=1 Tax=Streptomyces albipurpureus TaxID=2897419 RepID=A0ABT0UP87_9ACTN|nr:SIS domain-containing protein [Streptomyces sp. CWNU-1]MCM2389799.1 SIS domain-containing protein [Streptomyces sp. CWNU-1]